MEGELGEDIYYQSLLNRDRLVHIVDGDAGTCEALSALFRLEGFQTTFSLDFVSFYAGLERRRPDAIVLNLRVGSEDGIAVLRRIKALRTDVPVFMLTDSCEIEGVVDAMKAGAANVVTKPINTEHFARIVRDALPPGGLPPAARPRARAPELRGFAQLTPRERQVLQLISDGQSNKEAGRELGISPRTIEVHRARVMEKLGARNTAELMRIVLTK